MDNHIVVELLHRAQYQKWANLVLQKRAELAEWLSSLHPQKGIDCQVDEKFMSGGFNFALKATFADGTKLLLRFPKPGHVSAAHADEKVAVEARVLQLLAEKTSIPVPKVWHWGRAAGCPLGLGPFIIMGFVEGVSLDDVLTIPGQRFGRIRDDFPEDKIEFVFRQLARILLQLFHLDIDVDCIRNLPLPEEPGFSVPVRPLTYKVHNILQDGGVNVFGDDGASFESTTQYFHSILEQDMQQLLRQQNSAFDEQDAKAKYLFLSVLKSLLPSLVHPDYDGGPFKLMCDDLCPGNLIVKSPDDLTIVAVVDLEWSYVGPAQLLASAPWWLLGMRLINVFPHEDEDHPEITARYMRYLQIFKRVLAEEEQEANSSQTAAGDGGPQAAPGEFSRLAEWSQLSGAVWFHMLLLTGFNHHQSLPVERLQQHFGAARCEALAEQFCDADLDAFVKAKAREAAEYDGLEDKALNLESQFYKDAGSGLSAAALERYISDLTALVPENVIP